MRHPFDGLNQPGGVTRRGALGQMAAAAAGLLGLGTARGQQIQITTEAVGEEGGPPVATTLALGEEAGKLTRALGEQGNAAAVSTEPFGEEAGKVMSRAVPGLEDGRKPAVTERKGEDAGPTTKALGEEGGGIATTALGEAGGPLTRADGETGGPVVPVQPNTADLSAKQLEAVWADMGDKDPAKGVQACAVLYGAKQAVPFLKDHLKPLNVKVPPADEKAIAKLVADLDSDEFAVREQAEAALAKLGPAAVPALEKAAKEATSAEQRMRLQRLLGKAKEAPAQNQARRGLEVLVALRTPQARELLEALAKGDDKEWLTQEAKKALERASK